MKILFLGDVVGVSGRTMVFKSLISIIKDKQINFVVTNGENSADAGVGLTEEICKDFLIVEWTLSQQVIMFGIKKK